MDTYRGLAEQLLRDARHLFPADVVASARIHRGSIEQLYLVAQNQATRHHGEVQVTGVALQDHKGAAVQEGVDRLVELVGAGALQPGLGDGPAPVLRELRTDGWDDGRKPRRYEV